MKRRIGAATVVLAGVITVGCEQPQPSAPTLTPPLFAAATTTPVTATVTLTITAPGKQWLSDDSIAHIRDQTQSGSVSGDLTGTATVMGRSVPGHLVTPVTQTMRPGLRCRRVREPSPDPRRHPDPRRGRGMAQGQAAPS